MKLSYRPSGRSATARFFTVLVLATVLFSMLPALAPSGVGAQDGEEQTPIAEVQSDGEGEAPEPEVTEEPAPEPTSTAEAEPDPQAGGVAAAIAEARSCPPGFDLSTVDASGALANCVQPLAGIAFSLNTQNPAYPGDTRSTGGDGIAAWPDIPLGTGYTISETVPQGAPDPWVYCEVTGGPGADQYLYFPVSGGTIDIGLSDPNLASYAQTYCRWFNVQSGDPALALTPDAIAAAGEVHLTNYRCPVNYNTADMTLGALKAACTTVGDGFSFTLQASTGEPRTTTTDAQGLLAWTDVPSGNVTILESLPDGYRYAQPYCSVAPVGTPAGSPDLSLVQSDGKKITGQVAPGQALHCELFNIPVPQSTVAMIPFFCPPDYDTADMTLHALTVGCSIPGLNIEFTLTTADGEQFTGNTGTNGFLEWKNIPAGMVTIAQQAPPGYLAGPAYCDPAPPQGELDGTSFHLPTYDGDLVTYDIPERYTLNCVSFYVEGVAPTVVAAGNGTGSVTVQGYVCADELYDPTRSLQNYLDLCQTPNDGAQVRLFSAESGADLTAAISGGAPISFPDVPPGEAELNLLGDSGQNRLFCTTYPRGEAAPPVSAYAEVPVTVDIEGGYETSCYWFEFQELPDDAYVAVTVKKYLCGPEYPDTVVIDDWRAACTNPEPGVTFDLTHAGGLTASETTGADGIVSFRVLPGDIYIQPTPPHSLANGYAWCGAAPAGAEPAYVNAGRLNAGEPSMPLSDVDPSLVYSCEWFTVPMATTGKAADDGGHVTILKWRCPDDFDPSGKSYEELRVACPTPQEGVVIAVYYPTGAPFTALTRLEKGPAIARFEGLPPGNVGIGEPGTAGEELQRALCRTTDVGLPALALTDVYAEQTVADGGIAATIEDGKVIECHFFNVPTGKADSPPKAGSVYVDKRICPPGFSAISSNYIEIAMYCSSEPGVEFKIAYGETTISAITGADGIARFADIPPGIFRISELPREGYDPPKVFCRFTLVGAGATGSLDPVTVENWSVPSELKDGYFLECVWANMPAGATSTDPATVTLHTYTCPEGTDAYKSAEALVDDCAPRAEGVAFTAGAPLTTPAEAVTDAIGNVSFTNLSPGFNEIQQVAGNGFRPLAAWCDYYPGTAGEPDSLARYNAEPLYAYLSGGYTLECYWFDVPYVEPAQVAITMRVCPPTISLADLTNDRIRAECSETPAGVPFRVQAGNTSGTEPSPDALDVTLPTGKEGTVSFEELPPSPLRISELSPKYQTVAVNCGQAMVGESPSSYTSLTITDEGVAYPAEPHSVITCYWAAVEAPPVDIYVYKSVCPADYDYQHASQLDLNGACTPIDGVEFQVRNEAAAYDSTLPIGTTGYALFTDVPPGPILITELASDYQPVRVFCGHAPAGSTADPTEYLDLEISNGTIEYPATPDTVIGCFWFNIETTPATVTIHKYACPAGYLPPHSDSDQALLTKCSTPLEGVSFTLGGPATELTKTTDATGSVAWEEVAPGPLFISETPPAGYTSAVVFCAVQTSGSQQAAFESAPVTQFAIERHVAPGDALECYWFNLAPPDHPSPTPTPGTGKPPTPAPIATPNPTAPATLILTTYVCPEGYDVYGPESDLQEDCDEPAPGIEVSLLALAGETAQVAPVEIDTTDDDGVATFSGLKPGPWLLTESLPEETAAAFIASCASNQRDLDQEPLFDPLTYLSPDGQIGVVLIGGETLSCNAYIIPEETADE
ncbi:MAG: hypothetical protein R2855_00725 [Thermomicrobiales bacterium]